MLKRFASLLLTAMLLSALFGMPAQASGSDYDPNHPEKLVVPTVTGEMVRSKSEAMILMLLEYSGIPYRYECRLDIDRKAYYPDFTIRHPYTGEIFYWEHVGMLDDPSYRSDFHL